MSADRCAPAAAATLLLSVSLMELVECWSFAGRATASSPPDCKEKGEKERLEISRAGNAMRTGKETNLRLSAGYDGVDLRLVRGALRHCEGDMQRVCVSREHV
jgi:hypothetical protein